MPPTLSLLNPSAVMGLGMIAFAASSALSAAPSGDGSARPVGRAERWPVAFTNVRVRDAFWAPKQRVYRDRTIPHSWPFVSEQIADNESAAGRRPPPAGDAYPWSQANLHKVLETCAYALAQEPDPELDRKVDSLIACIAAGQQSNGYVNATITVRGKVPWTNLDGQHDGYVAGHMIEAAVAHYLATGKPDFLAVARRMADHTYRHFIEENHEGVCGHAELELALVRLYRVTGEPRYLELAREWIERRGKTTQSPDSPRTYFMDHLPIRDVPEVVGHAVRTMFYLTGVAEVATETGDAGLKNAARRLWLNTTRRKMYVTGSVGSAAQDEAFGPDYDLPNRGYCESCAACGLLYYAAAMFTLDGESDSIDVLERVLYNAVLHGISLDGTTTYYCNPLADANHPRDNCWVCCPPCLSRTLLRVQDYIYAQTDADLYVNLFVGSTADLRLGRTAVRVTQETRYPWDGLVRLTIEPESRLRFALRVRVPGWCRGPRIAVNGRPAGPAPLEKGYAVLRRKWARDDRVELTLPMPVERVQARPDVKEDAGRVALQRGPLVYGFEGLDNGGDADPVLPSEARFGDEYREDFLGGVVVVTAGGPDGSSRTAVPFYALANRDPSCQAVWVRQEGVEPAGEPWGDALYRRIEAGQGSR